MTLDFWARPESGGAHTSSEVAQLGDRVDTPSKSRGGPQGNQGRGPSNNRGCPQLGNLGGPPSGEVNDFQQQKC